MLSKSSILVLVTVALSATYVLAGPVGNARAVSRSSKTNAARSVPAIPSKRSVKGKRKDKIARAGSRGARKTRRRSSKRDDDSSSDSSSDDDGGQWVDKAGQELHEGVEDVKEGVEDIFDK